LAAYIGEINALKRRYPALLLHGTSRDTIGARVTGRVYYSVLTGPDAQHALVLRNPTANPQAVRAALLGTPAGAEAVLWRPFREEHPVTLPVQFTLGSYAAAVVFRC
jgi:hypothetical protein